MLRRLFIALMCLSLTGCGGALAALLPTLADVILAVQEGSQLLDQIEKFCDDWFAAHPDPEKKEDVGRAIGKTRSALAIATRMSSGATKLDQQRLDDAFADFKVAYSELLSLLGHYAVPVRPKSIVGPLRTEQGSGEVLFVPDEPLAMRLKARE